MLNLAMRVLRGLGAVGSSLRCCGGGPLYKGPPQPPHCRNCEPLEDCGCCGLLRFCGGSLKEVVIADLVY